MGKKFCFFPHLGNPKILFLRRLASHKNEKKNLGSSTSENSSLTIREAINICIFNYKV